MALFYYIIKNTGRARHRAVGNPQTLMLPLYNSHHKVPSGGLEPPLFSLEGNCFIRLSYEGLKVSKLYPK